MNNENNLDLLTNQLNRIDSKLDGVQQDIGQIKVTLVINTKDIAEHIRRTNLLETKIDKESLERDIQNIQNSGRLERLELPGKFINLTLKILAAISLIAGLIFTISRLI